MHRLTSSFVLGYHGCNKEIAEYLLKGESPRPSRNDYDWLGPDIYFWEANPIRGLQFAGEVAKRNPSSIRVPAVVGAVIELGLCLDLTTTSGIDWIKTAYSSLLDLVKRTGYDLPQIVLRDLDGISIVP